MNQNKKVPESEIIEEEYHLGKEYYNKILEKARAENKHD